MATLDQKQELIEVLKFTPRTYRISMWGYGGEKVMGTVDRASWDYCMDNQVDLSDIAWDSEALVNMDLDADQLPFQPGSWYECDSMGHVNGVNRDSGTLQIEDENGETVYERSLDACDGGSDDSPRLACNDEVWIGSRKKGEIVFIGSSNEKGTFFEGEIELTAPFKIELLELHYDEFDGEEIVSAIYYNGEEIDNFGGSTDGKSSDFTMVEIIDDEGNWERYAPGEKDWGTPECGTSPDDWEKSPTFKFAKHKPVHVGWYKCVWSHYGTTYGSAYWDGTDFVEFEYGKSTVIEGMDTWQGYNWDTTNWANRPPEPVETECKQCGWTGMNDDMREDDDYVRHCPTCDATDFNWINYDVDTKEGRANREKYCEPTAEEKAVFIAGLDAALAELAEESGIDFDNCEVDRTGETVATKGSWPF